MYHGDYQYNFSHHHSSCHNHNDQCHLQHFHKIIIFIIITKIIILRINIITLLPSQFPYLIPSHLFYHLGKTQKATLYS